MQTMTFRPGEEGASIAINMIPKELQVGKSKSKKLDFKKTEGGVVEYSTKTLTELRAGLSENYKNKGMNADQIKTKVEHVLAALSDPIKVDKHIATIQKLISQNTSKDRIISHEHGDVSNKVVCCGVELEAQRIHYNTSAAYIH